MAHKISHPYALIKDGLVHNIIATDHDETKIQDVCDFWECDYFINLCDDRQQLQPIGSDVYLGRLRPPRPFPSWSTFSESTWMWQSPIPYPADNKLYSWDETNLRWTEVTLS